MTERSILSEEAAKGPFRVDRDVTPWEMPREVFWDIHQGAHIRRAQWVVDNVPDVGVDDLAYFFALQPEAVAQLRMPEAGGTSST